MSIDKLLVGLLVAAVAVFGAFRLIAPPEPVAETAVPAAEPALVLMEERLRRLERHNNALEDRLILLETGAALFPEPGPSAVGSEAPEIEGESEEAVAEPAPPRRRNADQRQVERIEQAGLTEQEYELLETRAYELYLDNFEQEWLQRREAYLNGDPVPTSRQRLREELGDEAYDRYLFASGSSNRVRIGRVMPGSAAEIAGLQNGDVVLSYDGRRLFDFTDLRVASYRGEPGESVTLEVRRADGSIAQLVMPRGPMGISGDRGLREPPG